MNQKSFAGLLYGAVDLIRMLEHLSESCRRNPRVEVPWGGMSLTLAQAREMVSSALGALTSEAQSEEESLAPVPEDQGRNSGGVRELVDENYYEGTFNRVQLAREQPKDPLEH